MVGPRRAGCAVSEEIVLSFVDEGVSARAVLLTEHAPRTCAALLKRLPLTARVHHGIYSGSEVAMVLPEVFREPEEHATWEVSKGDIGYTWMAKGSHHGVDEDFAELCWFYDNDARPSMWDGPVAVNIFARLVDADDFHALCRSMRTAGAKTVEVRRG